MLNAPEAAHEAGVCLYECPGLRLPPVRDSPGVHTQLGGLARILQQLTRRQALMGSFGVEPNFDPPPAQVAEYFTFLACPYARVTLRVLGHQRSLDRGRCELQVVELVVVVVRLATVRVCRLVGDGLTKAVLIAHEQLLHEPAVLGVEVHAAAADDVAEGELAVPMRSLHPESAEGGGDFCATFANEINLLDLVADFHDIFESFAANVASSLSYQLGQGRRLHNAE